MMITINADVLYALIWANSFAIVLIVLFFTVLVGAIWKKQ